jgi:hypothetical protein
MTVEEAVVALVAAINGVGNASTESRIYREVESRLESLLTEITRMPQDPSVAPGDRSLEKTVRENGVEYRIKKAPVEITNKDGQVLPEMFTLKATARWKEGGHGLQNVVDALMNSCNVFFYNAGRVLGIDNIEAGAKRFGFGRATGIDLPNEVKGVVPGRSWKRIVKKGSWYEGDTVNLAIGQGYILVTPIQVLEMISIVANNGKQVKPYIVKRIDKSDVSPAPLHEMNFSKNALKSSFSSTSVTCK